LSLFEEKEAEARWMKYVSHHSPVTCFERFVLSWN